METMWALLKGKMGKGCKAAEALPLPEGKEELALVWFVLIEGTLVLFFGPVECGECEESFSLLMLASCVGVGITVLLILTGE